jgi:hypothetical protein
LGRHGCAPREEERIDHRNLPAPSGSWKQTMFLLAESHSLTHVYTPNDVN